jgi:hypothetical protein
MDEAGNIAETYSTIIQDTTPPHSLSLLINDGATETNSLTVTLKITAVDDLSGLFKISFSQDSITWSTWESYVDLTSLTLTSNDGKKDIYLKVMDKAGNIAEPIVTSIIYMKDTDYDGYADDVDAFPDDPAASIDSDGDGSPDYWNSDKSHADSTTGLHIDAFPDDPAASVDSDGDDYPDYWNSDMSEDDTRTIQIKVSEAQKQIQSI